MCAQEGRAGDRASVGAWFRQYKNRPLNGLSLQRKDRTWFIHAEKRAGGMTLHMRHMRHMNPVRDHRHGGLFIRAKQDENAAWTLETVPETQSGE